jgi:hypothetical protein
MNTMIRRLLYPAFRCFRRAAVGLICATFLLACGLEDFSYLDPIENVTINSTDSTVGLPAQSNSAFRHYTVFYRIYLSNSNTISGNTEADRNAINPQLSTHYKALETYTNPDAVITTDLITLFRNTYGYYRLCVLNIGSQIISLDDVLTSSASGTLKFDYNVTPPELQIIGSGIRLPLQRAAENFTPVPDRTLIATNSSLLDNSNIDTNRNRDVQNFSFVASSAYISLYIAATGINDNFSYIYSNPKHLGVFKLP